MNISILWWDFNAGAQVVLRFNSHLNVFEKLICIKAQSENHTILRPRIFNCKKCQPSVWSLWSCGSVHWPCNHKDTGAKPPCYCALFLMIHQHIRHISNCIILTQIIIIYGKLLWMSSFILPDEIQMFSHMLALWYNNEHGTITLVLWHNTIFYFAPLVSFCVRFPPNNLGISNNL